ncbi:winged helix-turn-helix transcriptional regulator [Actinomadura sp. 9N407]|uniref:winged helix-turn-helix transcriptional regulator n=1 Tax=Actinomadura sp. 9N407 TaxID=3375154 RepID=UPI0037B00504
MAIESLRPVGRPGGLTIHEPSCRSFQGILELVGLRGARRFGEYRLSVPGVSDRLLAQRLKELQTAGLISRTVIPSTPVQIRYELSADGQELMSVLQPLVDWSYRHSAPGADDGSATPN